MPIPRANPTVEPAKTFDEWYLTRLEIYPDPNGAWRVAAEFSSARDTGAPLLGGDGLPQLTADGQPRNRYELHPTEMRSHVVSDLTELARLKAAAGDARYLQAAGLVLQVVAEAAKAAGAID